MNENSFETVAGDGTQQQSQQQSQQSQRSQQGFSDRNLNPYPGDGRSAMPAARAADAPRAIHAKIIIILLACILAVSIAGLVLQVANPFATPIMRSGGPEFTQTPPSGSMSSGGSTLGGAPAPPTTSNGTQPGNNTISG